MEGRLPGDPLETAEEEGAEAPRGSIADVAKKALLAGVGALFMTEEGARRLARDWKLPKELIGFVTAQASGAKDEVLRLFAEEIRRFLESDSLRAEFWKMLTENSIEIRAEIRFRPDAAGRPKPHVTTSARARRGKKRSRP